MDHASITYFRRRERVERVQAEKATDPAAARIHREMADRYADRLATDADQAPPG